MEHSEKMELVAAALCAAQADMPQILKAGTNPHFKSKYVPLPDLVEAVRPVLVKHGLAIVQTYEPCPGSLHICTTLIHKSGQWLSGTLNVPLDKQTPQAVGSASTYGRRYSAESILFVCGMDDDDAESATERNGTRPHAAAQPVGNKVEDLI